MTTASNIHSNAFNFLSFVETGVDPRTGQYTCSLSLPELEGNDLSGPNVPLRLSYSPLNTVDSGFGKGWNLQLSQYDTSTHIVSLASGETFKVTSTTSDGSGQLLMKEQKIPSFRLFDIGNNRFRVVHKSGLVEELATDSGDALALPVIQFSPQGHRVTLSYTAFSGGRLLSSIANADGVRLLSVVRGSSSVSVKLHPGTSHEASFNLTLEGSESRVTRVELPTTPVASWRFGYATHSSLLCISRLEGPLGGSETLEYDNTPHQFPGPSGRTLPRVRRHLHEPGVGQAPIDTRYQYSSNNFLGRNAPGLSWEDNGLDNLYKVSAAYAYDSTEQLWDAANNRAQRSITRTFNRFHLTTEELTEQGDAVKRVRTHYYADDSSLPFEQQPAQCQLPKTVTTTWYRKSTSGQTRDEVVRSEYDIHGNLTLQVQANGISEASEYYPAGASDGCPADPHNFVRHLKQKTVTPAKGDVNDAPVLRTQHRYISQPGLSGSTWPWLALEQETLIHVNGGNAELQKTRHTYVNAPTDSLTHGRRSQTAITLNGKTTTTDYAYVKATGQYAAQPVLRTMETLKTSFDAVSKVIILEHSLLNGRTLLERDDNDVEIAYSYDKLGRVIEEKVAPGSSVEALRQYRYLLVDQVTGQPTQTAIDVKKVETRSVLDGLQRVVSELRQDADGDPVNKPLRQTYSATYDAFGQLSESTEFDWLGSQTAALTSRYTYDDWGEQDSVTGPDGVIAHALYDPVSMTRRTWQEGTDGKRSNVDRVTYNLFEKPLKSDVLDSQDQVVSTAELRYDGLGHCRQEISVLGKSTFYRYDPWDRVSLTVLPDETQIVRAYAEHSSAELAVSIDVTPGGGNRATLRLGEQQFDGLERLTRADVGPRSQQYRYTSGQLQPDERITASGQSIHYEYTPNLTHQPVGLIALDEQASYTYDGANAQLTVTENNQGRREFDYDSASYLSHERWIVDGTTWEALSTYSLAGRLIQHTDVNGQQSVYAYDQQGRVETVTQGRLHASFAYDSLGRAWRTTTRDLDAGTELVTSLTFDDHGREIERALALSGQPTQTLTQTWRLDNRLQSRHQQSAGTSLLKEVFDYDVRGRLISHDCSGQTLPTDRYGNAIAAQTFAYDGLDNLLQVSTRFADGSNDESTRSFADDDPCQLVRITHTHADYPASQDLSYDADGHLLADENGNGLHYDSQGRLLRVTDESGQDISEYRYDGHNQLTGVTHGEEAQTRRFYQGSQLGSTVQGNTRISYLYDGDRPLGQQQMNAPAETLLLLTDANRSVRGESQQQTLRETAYGAYGERGNDGMKTVLGFNGEVRDSLSGWYLLGKGHRAYNPELRCFHSPDGLSPFGAGGLNPYMYCGGDSVNRSDPTGQFWQGAGWVGLGLGVLGAGLTLLSFGGLAPAYAAMMSGGLAAAAKGGAALTAIAAGAGALGTGVAQSLVSDRQTQKVLGQIGFGLGIASAVLGLGAFKLNGWKGGKASTVDDAASPTGPWRNPQAYNSTPSALPQKTIVHNVATQTPPPPPPKPIPTTQPVPPTSGPRPSLEDLKNVKLKKTSAPTPPQGVKNTELDLMLSEIRNGKTVTSARKNPNIQQGNFSKEPVYDLNMIRNN